MIKKTVFAPVFIFVVGFFFSLFVAFSLYKSEEKVALKQLQKNISSASMAFAQELNVSVNLLYLVQDKLLGTKGLTENTFQYIAKKFSKRLPYAHSIKWIEAVKTKKIENQSDTNNKQDHHFSVRFSSQGALQPSVQELDLFSIPFFKEKLLMSWHQAIPIAIFDPNLQKLLLEEQDFFILFPVFTDESNTKNQRIEHIKGFFLVMLDVDHMFESTLAARIKEPITLSLLAHDKDENILYEKGRGISEELVKRMAYSSPKFFFAGNEWQIKSIPSKKYIEMHMTNFPYFVFIFGCMIFTTMTYSMYWLQVRVINQYIQLEEKARDLRNANRKLEKISRTDGLTGLFNREYFDDIVDIELKRSQRDEMPISLLLVEIDNFDNYVENNGRKASNNLIRMVGLTLKESLKRPSDLVARFDSQSFAVLLPNTLNGFPIAESVVDAIWRLKIPVTHANGHDFVSVSVGGAGVAETQTLNDIKLKNLAKISLSKAIASGRNRAQWIFPPE